jgi:hypothetical protein
MRRRQEGHPLFTVIAPRRVIRTAPGTTANANSMRGRLITAPTADCDRSKLS